MASLHQRAARSLAVIAACVGLAAILGAASADGYGAGLSARGVLTIGPVGLYCGIVLHEGMTTELALLAAGSALFLAGRSLGR